MPVLAVNKKAHFDYELLDSFEAGLVLSGPEVKSAKAGQVSLKGAYVVKKTSTKQTEFWLMNATVTAYKFANNEGYDPNRSRLLLLTKAEINRLIGKTQEKGYTLVPTKMYTKGSFVKLEFCLARGKKAHDKRESLKKKDVERDMRRVMKGS
jgi:SsrA-binding protein